MPQPNQDNSVLKMNAEDAYNELVKHVILGTSVKSDMLLRSDCFH